MAGPSLKFERTAETSQALALIHEGVSELWQEGLSPTQYLKFPVGPDNRVIHVLSADEDPVGVICYRLDGPEAIVTLIYVEPSSRRAGLATKLWQAMLEDLEATPAKTVRVDVSSVNFGGRDLVKALGATPIVNRFEQGVPRG